MTFRKVPTKTEGLNTTRRGGDFLADNARPCLSDRCPTFADSKDYLTAYRDAGNEKELRKRNGGTPSGTLFFARPPRIGVTSSPNRAFLGTETP